MDELLCDLVSNSWGILPHMCDREVFLFDADKGILEFNGREIPKQPTPISCTLTIHQLEGMPYLTTEYQFHYHYVRYEQYDIEIDDVENIEDTSHISTIHDEEGEEMNVCFMPTMRQRITFRIISTN